MFTVLKPFNSRNRRFQNVGASISADDIADDVMSIDARVSGGYLAAAADSGAAEPAAADTDASMVEEAPAAGTASPSKRRG